MLEYEDLDFLSWPDLKCPQGYRYTKKQNYASEKKNVYTIYYFCESFTSYKCPAKLTLRIKDDNITVRLFRYILNFKAHCEGAHNNKTHRYYEQNANQVSKMLFLTEEEQKKLVIEEALENPARAHPIGLSRSLHDKCKNSIASVISTKKINNTLQEFRKQTFLSADSIELCLLSKTFRKQSFCSKVSS